MLKYGNIANDIDKLCRRRIARIEIEKTFFHTCHMLPQKVGHANFSNFSLSNALDCSWLSSQLWIFLYVLCQYFPSGFMNWFTSEFSFLFKVNFCVLIEFVVFRRKFKTTREKLRVVPSSITIFGISIAIVKKLWCHTLLKWPRLLYVTWVIHELHAVRQTLAKNKLGQLIKCLKMAAEL